MLSGITAATVQLEARVHLSDVNKPNRDEDAHNDADGKHSEYDFDLPASLKRVASHNPQWLNGRFCVMR